MSNVDRYLRYISTRPSPTGENLAGVSKQSPFSIGIASGETLFREIHSAKQISLICYSRRNDKLVRNYKIVVGSRLPYDGALLGHCLANNMLGSRLLDVGSGTGIVSIHACSFRPDVQALGIEISRSEFSAAQSNIKLNRLEDRCAVLLQDLFEMKTVDMEFDTVVCNPPMLPGELGFVSGQHKMSFTDALLQWIVAHGSSSCRDVFIHFFDFLGITNQTGNWPSLNQLATKYGFELAVVQNHVKQLSPGSRTRAAMLQLGEHFPLGEIIVNHKVIRIHEFTASLTFNENMPIGIPQSFVRLRRTNL